MPNSDRPARLSVTRRELLGLGALSAISWLASPLALGQDPAGRRARKKALIVLWLDGGPSQLETFDPKPGTPIGGPTRAIRTRLRGVQVAEGFPRLADRMDRVALIRSMVTHEGAHERGRYLMRTSYAMTPTVAYPTLGAVVAHELPRPGLELPPHVALLARHPPRGGFLGKAYDAFVVGDPSAPLPDLTSRVKPARYRRRLGDLDLLEEGFAGGRREQVQDTQHRALAREARRMMTSAQLEAFAYRREPAATVEAYGDVPFGRGCLVARRLVEAGVPAIEVTLTGWDTHVDDFERNRKLAPVLDRALAALLDDLAARDLLRSTLVLCGGEFGRTPRINALEGRDHWTRGFSFLLAGGGIRGGVVTGETDPRGEAPPTAPVTPQDLFATVYEALGIRRGREFDTPQGRPIRLNQGRPQARLQARAVTTGG